MSKQRSASKEDDWDWEDGTFDDANGEDDNNNEAASVSAVSLYVEKLVEIFKVVVTQCLLAATSDVHAYTIGNCASACGFSRLCIDIIE